ncbi:MerC domain-containing protein [Mucilaginibacter gilvus]|uniref:MerC domain-containing protein n=1 Tax=Mucilaginibacter gilvus TaxID=2305909 RepID=A0A444MI82_9SPHI|nr:MerC domain-containing protein [Mucilaginibacter gilvus]RWY47460.1 MerC domain-containing protein [Mucilaginibacter gilvus]
MKLFWTTINLDNIGMTASTLCAIHCAVVPVIFTSLPLIGLSFLANPWIEWSMIILALFIGFYAISTSYLFKHRKVLPVILLLGGFTFILLGHTIIKGWPQFVMAPMGGLLIAFAHFVNYKYQGICDAQANIFHLKHLHHEKSRP